MDGSLERCLVYIDCKTLFGSVSVSIGMWREWVPYREKELWVNVGMVALTSLCNSVHYIHLYKIITVLSTAYHYTIPLFSYAVHSPHISGAS